MPSLFGPTSLCTPASQLERFLEKNWARGEDKSVAISVVQERHVRW